MEPAASIIAKLGGVTVVARALNVNIARVTAWRRPRGRSSGTGGAIPHWHVARLLEFARERGVPLSPLDFAPVPDQQGSAA